MFKDFVRSNDADRRNGLLNYGYAILRAALARVCVGVGLIPCFGLHHHSRSNAFNLVDDLIEPFRPLVDMAVLERLKDAPDGTDVSLDDRRAMAGILHRTVVMTKDTADAETMTLLVAAENVATSLVKAMETKDSTRLRLPSFPLDYELNDAV